MDKIKLNVTKKIFKNQTFWRRVRIGWKKSAVLSSPLFEAKPEGDDSLSGGGSGRLKLP